MVDDVDAHDQPHRRHPFGEVDVVRTGRRIAGRMIVKQDDRSRRRGNGLTEHLARVHDGGVERPDRDDSDPDQPVLRVEHHDAELFDGTRPVQREKIRRDVLRRAQSGPIVDRRHHGAPAQLDGGQRLRGPYSSDSAETMELVEAHARQAVKAARLLEHRVGELEGVAAARSIAEDERQQLVVTEPRNAEAFELLAWPILGGERFHLYSRFMSRRFPREASVRWILLTLPLLHAACAAPPNKEIGDAQNALKAAQSAGAEQYAKGAYDAASNAYRVANEAVGDGDYRKALDQALESQRHAQEALRLASDLNLRSRDDVQRLITDVATLQALATSRIDAAERAGVPRRTVVDARRSLVQVSGEVQKAGAAIKVQEFAKALPILQAVKARLERTLKSVEAAMPQSAKRSR